VLLEPAEHEPLRDRNLTPSGSSSPGSNWNDASASTACRPWFIATALNAIV
jgi:hypothetical protein